MIFNSIEAYRSMVTEAREQYGSDQFDAHRLEMWEACSSGISDEHMAHIANKVIMHGLYALTDSANPAPTDLNLANNGILHISGHEKNAMIIMGGDVDPGYVEVVRREFRILTILSPCLWVGLTGVYRYADDVRVPVKDGCHQALFSGVKAANAPHPNAPTSRSCGISVPIQPLLKAGGECAGFKVGHRATVDVNRVFPPLDAMFEHHLTPEIFYQKDIDSMLNSFSN